MEINIFDLIWFAVSYCIAFYIGYQFILVGLKIFKIEEVSKNKVRNYIIATFVIGLFFDATIYPSILLFLKTISNKIILVLIASFWSSSTTFLIAFLFFKYYFLLSGKKLWQLALYVASITLIILLAINGLLAIL